MTAAPIACRCHSKQGTLGTGVVGDSWAHSRLRALRATTNAGDGHLCRAIISTFGGFRERKHTDRWLAQWHRQRQQLHPSNSIRHHDETDEPIDLGDPDDYQEVLLPSLDPRFEGNILMLANASTVKRWHWQPSKACRAAAKRFHYSTLSKTWQSVAIFAQDSLCHLHAALETHG